MLEGIWIPYDRALAVMKEQWPRLAEELPDDADDLAGFVRVLGKDAVVTDARFDCMFGLIVPLHGDEKER